MDRTLHLIERIWTTARNGLGALLFFVILAAVPAAGQIPPSQAFELKDWKLQIPGPKEFKDLRNCASRYFFLTPEKEMCFSLDAAEQGTTPNTKYVRSELRHLPNWKFSGAHTLEAEVRAVSHLQPDKLTVLQIHGITEKGGNEPPLLRVALNGGNLYAAIKKDNQGEETELVLLKPNVGTTFVKVGIHVQDHLLRILVDGVEKLSRDLSFWPHENYFKAGLYPQATHGTAEVYFRRLQAE